MLSAASCVDDPSGSVTSTASAQRTSGAVSASAETPTAAAMRSVKMSPLAAAASAAARSKTSCGGALAGTAPTPAPTSIVYSTRVRSKRMPPAGSGSSAPSTLSTFSESMKPSATSSETYSSMSSRSCKSVMCSSASRKPPSSTRSAVASVSASAPAPSPRAAAAPIAATICASRPSTGKMRVETVPRGVPRLVATVAATAARSTFVSSGSSNARTPTTGNVTATAASSGVAAPTENATASRNLDTMSPLTSSERRTTSRCSEGADPSPSAPADWGRDADATAGTTADTSIAPRSNAAVTAKKTRDRVREMRIAPGTARRSSSSVQPCDSSSGASETSPSWQTPRGCCVALRSRQDFFSG